MYSISQPLKNSEDLFFSWPIARLDILQKYLFFKRSVLMLIWILELHSLDQTELESQPFWILSLENLWHLMVELSLTESVESVFSPSITWKCSILDSLPLRFSIKGIQKTNLRRSEDILVHSESLNSLLLDHLLYYRVVKNLECRSLWFVTRVHKFYYWMSQQIIWITMPLTLWSSHSRTIKVVSWLFPMTSTS